MALQTCLQTTFKTCYVASRLVAHIALAKNLSVYGTSMVGGGLGRACCAAQKDGYKQQEGQGNRQPK